MLNPEVAQARLKEYQITDWQATRLAKLIKLPAKLRSIGCGIFGHDDKGKSIRNEKPAYTLTFKTVATIWDRSKLINDNFGSI